METDKHFVGLAVNTMAAHCFCMRHMQQYTVLVVHGWKSVVPHTHTNTHAPVGCSNQLNPQPASINTWHLPIPPLLSLSSE